MSTALSKKTLYKALISFFLFAVLIALAHFLGLADMLDTAWIDAHISQNGVQGYALFVGLSALLTVIGIPRPFLSFLAGYAFGALLGTLWATIGALMGAVVVFFYARFAAREALQRRFGPRVARFDSFFARNPLAMSIVVRCLPLGNNLITSMTAGVSSVPAPQFFLGSCIGYIPQNYIFALLGSGVTVSPFMRIGVSGILLVLSLVLGVYLFKKYRGEYLLQSNKED